jgi:hypothetical protein
MTKLGQTVCSFTIEVERTNFFNQNIILTKFLDHPLYSELSLKIITLPPDKLINAVHKMQHSNILLDISVLQLQI